MKLLACLASRVTVSMAVAGVLFAMPSAFAQQYPSRPIKIIVPYAAGGTTDSIGRILAEALGRRLGQPVVVENRNGSGGVVGANAVPNRSPTGTPWASPP